MPYKIMVVEDDKPIREMMEILLKTSGYEPVLEPDALQALRDVEKNSPDLVLLDIMMSPINGWEFLRRVREDMGRAEIPVILFTAMSTADEQMATMNDPKLGLLMKPVTLIELKAGIEKFLGKN